MAEVPPQLGDLPSHSEFNIPTLSSQSGNSTTTAPPATQSNGTSSMQNAKNTVMTSELFSTVSGAARVIKKMSLTFYLDASSAYSAVADHPATKNMAETVSNAPVTQAVKAQTDKTSAEYSNLANSRTKPTTTAANGQQLTNYHSFFFTLLSWENPRVTAISYVAVVAFIFAARYLPILRLGFKGLWMTLGATALAEIAGKTILSHGLTSSFRPKKYYTIPRETLEASLEDIEQLINFFVIEFQRILFAENIAVTLGAFFVSLLSHLLVKLVPFWGLALIGVSSAYLVPLVYINNKAIIDEQLAHVSDIANSQANQVKEIAGHHTTRATESIKSYAGDYSAKASEMIGNARGRSTSPEAVKKSFSEKDFPAAPNVGPETLPSAPNGAVAPKAEPSLI